MVGGGGCRERERGKGSLGKVLRSWGVDCNLNVKASLVAVLFAVVDVVSEHFALDAQFGVESQIGELQRHQRLQVVGLQQLAVVRVILHGEAAADAVVLNLPNFSGVLLFLEGGRDKRAIREGTERAEAELRTERAQSVPCWCSRWGWHWAGPYIEPLRECCHLSWEAKEKKRWTRITFFSRWKHTSTTGRICQSTKPIQSYPGLDQVGRLCKTNHIYPWTEVDDPVELHDHAGFAVLESKLAVLQARAGSKQRPVETAGLPDPHVALQFATVPILSGLIWRTKQGFIGAKIHEVQGLWIVCESRKGQCIATQVKPVA